jgi:hypothetical protein
MIEVKNNQSPVDISISIYGGIEGIMQLWRDNADMLFTADLAAGDVLEYDATLDFTDQAEVIVAAPPAKHITDLVVVKDQNIIDLAIQQYGSIDGLMQLWSDNQDLTADAEIAPGAAIKVNAQVVTNSLNKLYLDKRGVRIATGVALGTAPPVWVLETGSWNDGGIWIDTSNWNDGV